MNNIYELNIKYEQLGASLDDLHDSFSSHVNGRMTTELLIALHDVSVEGGKFNLLLSYVEKIYTFVMKIANNIKLFAKRLWLRVRLGVRSDEEKDELLSVLKDNKHYKVRMDKALKKLVAKEPAYFFLRANNHNSENIDPNALIKASSKARRELLNGNSLEIKLETNITKDTVGKNFVITKDMTDFKDEITYLSCKGNKAYFIGQFKEGGTFGSGYKVLSAVLREDLYDSTYAKVKNEITVKNTIKDLEDMVPIGTLYNILTNGLFLEIEAIEHDLDASRLRMLKDANSHSNGTIDDIKNHEANIKAKSNNTRTIVGLSKALLHIGNGMIYDRNMRLKIARIIANQIKKES